MMRLAKPRFPKLNYWLAVTTVILAAMVISVAAAGVWYRNNLLPVSKSTDAQLFTVDEGNSARQIATSLKSLGLIRNTRAFLYYVDSKNYRSKLQAGTYKLSPSLSSQQIATKMATGEIDRNWLTILPAKRLDQVKQEFLRVGYPEAEVEAAFDPSNYRDIPLVSNLPAGATLEGLLYPDSFQRTSDSPASDIVRQSLNEMQGHLTPDIVAGFNAQGLNTYQGLTLASIVYQESGLSDQPTVAQVFISRLRQGIALGSDVTAYYAAALAGAGKTIGVDSPYNTRLHTGLPPGPISNLQDSALQAVAHPSSTDYLYFVAGDDGTLHFSHNEAEHEAAIKQYCHSACQ